MKRVSIRPMTLLLHAQLLLLGLVLLGTNLIATRSVWADERDQSDDA